ncbi:MAG: DUF1704 domain-containing protein [Polyangiaceae bacterium]
MRADLRDRALERASVVLEPVSKDARLLDLIAWPRNLEEEFFSSGCSKLPKPSYDIDRQRAEKHIEALKDLSRELAGDHLLFRWLRSICDSYISANKMLLAVGTKAFYKHSLDVYGGAATTALDADTSNLDFAQHVSRRLGDSPPPQAPESERLTTEQFVAETTKRLAKREPALPVEIVVDEKLTAKAICGATRLRVRVGATFDRVEARGLFHHEIETHALTAQNGAAQPKLSFLRGGGPRTTRTQEGLAVFSELYNHALTTDRLRRLVERVRLVGMAEDGASFVDLFRHLVDQGLPERSAYLDAQRICRGGLAEGGAPFTKDACYLSGLMDVYNFLRVALRSGAGHVPRLLVSGRMALEDIAALDWLRREGVLVEPVHLPGWVKRWDELLAYFAFTSFLNEVDLEPIERRHRALLRAKS